MIQMNPLQKKTLRVSLLFCLVLFFGINPIAQSAPQASPEEQFILDESKRFIKDGHLTEGLSSLELFYTNHPESPLAPDALIEIGKTYAEQGDLKKAIASYRLFLEKFPKHPEANAVRFKLSSTYLQAGGKPGETDQNIEKALSVWNKIEEVSEFKNSIYTRASEIYIEREEYANALRVLVQKKVAVSSPAEAAQIGSAIIALIRNRLSTKELLTLASEFSPRFPSDEAMMQLIKTYDKNGIYYLEEKEGKRFLSLFPNHAYAPEVERLIEAIQEKIKENDYLIGVILPLSGKLESFGMSALQGVELALKQFKSEFPKSGVGLVIRDRVESEAAIEEWADEYAPLCMIGPLMSKEVNLIAPVVERGSFALITPGATAAKLPAMGTSVFRNATTPASQCHAISEHAVSALALKRFAIFSPNDTSGKEWVRCLRANITEMGGVVALVQSYAPHETDFKSTIEPLKKTYEKKIGEQNGFDAIFLPGDTKAIGLILPQLAFYGLKNIPLLGTMGWADPGFLKRAGAYAEGAVFVDGFFQESQNPVIQSFVQAYKEQFQQDPNLFAAQAYDSANMIFEAIKQGANTPSKVTAAIAKTEGLEGVSGFISEMKDGEAIKKPFLLQIRKGKLVQVN
ncbi:MAG: ABC transporter substrate-binding protein [Nitrospirota bacterium]